ncbi:MAG: hypothetical protein COU35_02635 [Candidatus Magasanikbacteria bacterium CG10_big_fil_rev_8_21_14_0_10_47_10]|uniref:N-acetylmuramoyl-L-alanine amidase n=1 Tax=Candidatus Magasanikbacteria bacterium CG10_big_fil_rev_8_21_14_0_10_47_10 TaxID=1974652 RepID=A0A2H0TQP6_9BACT|nr:MAG: hypothetical protein COU35_02635 [Candidatus Magasanikbacteria bacterium CG10_big_fil_rev_8_21_14_0_10_47_10]
MNSSPTSRQAFRAALLCMALLLFLLPAATHAQNQGLLKIGSECPDNSLVGDATCETGNCEKASTGKFYCTCTETTFVDSTDCEEAYGAIQGGWECNDGASATYDLNYCVSDENINTVPPRYPIPPTDASLVDQIIDPSISADEIRQLTIKPVTKINIPGLNFSDQKVTEENGSVFLSVPFLGEYIAAFYKWAIAAAAVVAVVAIIRAGLMWTMSGGNETSITAAKKNIGNAIIGLMLLVGSYTILYTINPELVQFRNLRVRYIEANTSLIGDHGEIDDTESVESEPGSRTDCSSYPSGWKGIDQCRKDCIAKLVPDDKSKPSGAARDISSLGYIDCSAVKGRRTLESIEYVAIHEGKKDPAIAWWWLQYVQQGPEKAYGTHYFIGRNGTISQVTDETFIVWHGNKNRQGIGVDLDAGCRSSDGSAEASKKCDYTAAQYASLQQLINSIVSRTNVIFDDDHILGHCQASDDPKKGHVDPRNFDWSKIGLTNKAHKGVRCIYSL